MSEFANEGAQAAEWFYLRVSIQESIRNEDPTIFGEVASDRHFLPFDADVRYFFKIQGRDVADRLVRLFAKEHEAGKYHYSSMGDVRERCEFVCCPVVDFDEDEQFLIDTKIAEVQKRFEAGKADEEFSLSSECLYGQAVLWLRRLAPDSTAATPSKVANPHERMPEPQALPTTVPPNNTPIDQASSEETASPPEDERVAKAHSSDVGDHLASPMLRISDTEQAVLKAVVALGADCEEERVMCPAIAREAKMDSDARIRSTLSNLRKRGMLGGKPGEQGYWMTAVGKRALGRK